VFSYLSFKTSLSWLDENCQCHLTEWDLRSRKAAFFGDPHTMWPWLLGQITHNKVEKELGIQLLNNLYASNYSSGELLWDITKENFTGWP